MVFGIKTLFLQGPVGRLEALLKPGAPGATHAALVCHPHPLFGGTMHNKVVYHAMKALNSFGFPVLRFNFRGVGLSEGAHAKGRGEVEDARAALNWLDAEFHLPMIFCGFSFGAATGLRAAYDNPHVAGLIALGPPHSSQGRLYSYDFLKDCAKPKLLVAGANDKFSSRTDLKALYDSLPGPKVLAVVEDGDHFFAGHLAEMQSAIQGWVSGMFRLQPVAEAEE
jgi:hypothetical protein